MRTDYFWICALLAFVLFYADEGQPSLHSQIVKHYSTCSGEAK